MPSLVPHPVTGKPVWDYDLPDDVPEKPAKKAAKKPAKTEED